jgi:hypothetical protein
MSKNKIQKVNLEILFTKGITKDMEVIDTAASLFYNKIQPELNKILDVYDDNSIVRIDKVEIDLGLISEDNIGEAFAKEFGNKLQENKAYQKINNFVFSHSNQSDRKIKQSDQNHLQSLIYFLSGGKFPWYFEKNNSENNPEFILNTVITKSDRTALKQLIQLVITDISAAERFILQFEIPTQIKLITSVYAENRELPQFISKFIYEYLTILKNEIRLQGIKFYVALIDAIVNGTLLNDFSPMKFLTFLADKKIISEIQLKKLQSIQQTRLQIKNGKKLKTNTSEILTNAKLLAKLANKSFNKQEQESLINDNVNETNSILISNAGIILIFPFLEALFTHLSLIKNNKFVSRSKQMRAIQLIHYLAYGDKKTPENMLQLNKVLCTYPLNAPVLGYFRMSEKEEEECTELLETILSHWQALKSSSIQGLRETFFQREGSLRKDGNDWILTVEKKAFDILLEQIPWSFRTVKLPWNNYVIHVEW